MRLIKTYDLQIEEAMLNGESISSEKSIAVIREGLPMVVTIVMDIGCCQNDAAEHH